MPSSDESVVIATWTNRLTTSLIPVRATTIRELELLRAREDQVDANSLGEVVAADALMTLRVMSHVASLRGPRQQGEPQTVTAALVWLGIQPFFRNIQEIMSVEQALQGYPTALQHVERRLTTDHLAARLALAFAIERGEPDAPLLHHAALLHDFHELLLWIHEPAAALQIEAVQAADQSISRAQAQRQVLGFELIGLKQPMSRLLRLPRSLEYCNNPGGAERPAARCVEFALEVAAREVRTGVEDSAPEANAAGMEALSDWLNASESRLQSLLTDAGCRQVDR